jgi:hypothetical protein
MMASACINVARMMPSNSQQACTSAPCKRRRWIIGGVAFAFVLGAAWVLIVAWRIRSNDAARRREDDLIQRNGDYLAGWLRTRKFGENGSGPQRSIAYSIQNALEEWELVRGTMITRPIVVWAILYASEHGRGCRQLYVWWFEEGFNVNGFYLVGGDGRTV